MTISSPSRPYLDGKKLNKIEQNKAAKDGLLVGSEIEKFAELGWEQVDETALQSVSYTHLPLPPIYSV